MYRDYLGISTLVIKCFGITNTSVQNFAIRISSVKTVPKCLRKLEVFFNKFNIDVSSLLMSQPRAIVICQKYFGNHVISSQIHFTPLLNMRRCNLCSSCFCRLGSVSGKCRCSLCISVRHLCVIVNLHFCKFANFHFRSIVIVRTIEISGLSEPGLRNHHCIQQLVYRD